MPGLFQRMGDSLLAVLGEPNQRGPDHLIWTRHRERVHLSIFPPTDLGGARVSLYHTGAGDYAESTRRIDRWAAARLENGADTLVAGEWVRLVGSACGCCRCSSRKTRGHEEA
jgi:hypothetical protein